MSDLETELIEVCDRHQAKLCLLGGAFFIRPRPRSKPELSTGGDPPPLPPML